MDLQIRWECHMMSWSLFTFSTWNQYDVLRRSMPLFICLYDTDEQIKEPRYSLFIQHTGLSLFQLCGQHWNWHRHQTLLLQSWHQEHPGKKFPFLSDCLYILADLSRLAQVSAPAVVVRKADTMAWGVLCAHTNEAIRMMQCIWKTTFKDIKKACCPAIRQFIPKLSSKSNHVSTCRTNYDVSSHEPEQTTQTSIRLLCI